MRKLLFFDDFFFTRQRNLVRRFHTPRWLPDGLYLDRFTRYGIGYASVWPALDAGYLLHYTTLLPGNRKVLSMARSADGIHWEPEHFDPPRFAGFPHVVFPQDARPRGSALCTYHDPDDPDPARRYKAVDPLHAPQQFIGMAYSADGLHWECRHEHRLLEHGSDTMLSMLRNPRTGMYQVHLRPWTGDRRIFRIESPDCATWSAPQLVLHPSPLDPPMTQLYGMPQFRYGDMFVGFLWNYHTPFDTAHPHKATGVIDTELTYSYDGRTWNRTHRPFMSLRDWGQYGGGSQQGCALLERADDLLVYSSARIDEHQHGKEGDDTPRVGLIAGTLRHDGFVGMTTRDGGTGEFFTDCLYARSPELALNVQVPRGAVRVAVCDTMCQPLPGYTLEDCIPLTGDGRDLRPRWREHADMTAAMQLLQKSDPAGWLRLHVQLDRAELFAIRGDFGLDVRSGAPGIDLP